MEGLTRIIKQATYLDVFNGIRWSKGNALNLRRLLRGFYLISGLRISSRKSRFYGVGVNDNEIAEMVSDLRVASGHFPFTHLGVPIASNMNLVRSWDPVLEKVRKSGRGWTNVPVKISIGSAWKQIASVPSLLPIGSDKAIKANLRNGSTIFFWYDWWLSDDVLHKKFPLLFALEKNKACLVSDRLPSSSQHSNFNVGSSNEFSVKNVKKCVFEATNVIPASSFEWCNWVPKKVVVVAWRAFLDLLPTVDALSRRNIHVGPQLCSICETNMESVDHLFTGCPIFMEVWQLVFSWCQVPPFFVFHVRDLLCLHLTAKSGTRAKKAFYGVILTAFWSIWKARNDHIFNQKKVSVRRIMEEIKVMSYLWITKRGRMTDMTWDSWGRFDSLKMG
ncbi:uncharacterized protein LOC110900426 [Helianthus annuus]|uniref:uncharacterized protein LOC110900426 n=1 Tax=Helianthus annuus TaxID=4232 RepID=UPI000B8FC2B5|nr:uncharacterized protein LOC110900426 [Helianthus annuus]